MIKYHATSGKYEIEDPGGWRFTIETYWEDSSGWQASVRVTERGLNTERAAIAHLRTPLRRLLAQLDEEWKDE